MTPVPDKEAFSQKSKVTDGAQKRKQVQTGPKTELNA